MKRSLFFSLVVLLWGVSSFAQEAKAPMSPAEVTAGKNITITIIVDKAPSVEGTTVSVVLAPRDSKDNGNPFGLSLAPKNGYLKTYVGTTQVPINARGASAEQVL